MGCGNSKILAEMHAELIQLRELLTRVTHRLTHVLDAKSADILDKGALFFVHDVTNTPLCVGCFVSPAIAVTVNHFSDKALIRGQLHAVSCHDSETHYIFDIVSRHEDFDLTVLRLSHEQRAPAFFTISESDADSKPGRKVAFITMSIGPSSASAPMIGLGEVVIKRRDPQKKFLYFNSEAWRGDSGTVLLVEDGRIVAMFLSTTAEVPLSPLVKILHCHGAASPAGSQCASAAAGSQDAASADAGVTQKVLLVQAIETAVTESGLLGRECRALILAAVAQFVPVQ